MATLRSFIFIDQLQPQTLCYLGSWIRGSLPRANMAAQIIEVAPGLDIEALTDVALKHAEVQAGILVVERQFGYLEFHCALDRRGEGGGRGGARRRSGARPSDAMRPKVLASRIVTRIDPQHAFLINRNKVGSMVARRASRCSCSRCEPAAYAILATNEAEKAANVKVVDYRMIGATGRVYLAGTEAEIATRRRRAAEQALEAGVMKPHDRPSPAGAGARGRCARRWPRRAARPERAAPAARSRCAIASDADLTASSAACSTRRTIGGRGARSRRGAALQLAGGGPATARTPPAKSRRARGGSFDGLVSERQIDRLAGGRDARGSAEARRCTPLARDRARQRGIEIERRR